MAVGEVLLVLVGALGDLAWRKFLKPARSLEMEMKNPRVRVLLVDVPWRRSALALEDQLRLRIGRRLIELRAESIYNADSAAQIEYEESNGGAVRPPARFFTSDIGLTPLPWDIDKFASSHLDPAAGDAAGVRAELARQLEEYVGWFTGETLPGLPRYAPASDELFERVRGLKRDGTKVAVYVAVPPEFYPQVTGQWEGLADRLVLEKPAAGLDRELKYAPADGLLEAVARLGAEAQGATSDHYNSKLMTRAMDRIRDYHLFDHLLEPRRIRRIVVELLETAPLPMGRCNFYNGAGGPFGDMAPHVFQMVRAVLGLTTGTLDVRFGERFCRALYRDAPVGENFGRLSDPDYEHEPSYYRPLDSQTETFVAFDAFVLLDGREIPLYGRTGKGFSPERKTLRVDCCYDEATGAELSITFRFDKAGPTIIVTDDWVDREFWLEAGPISLQEEFSSGVPGLEPEYRGIFECLARSDWGPSALDGRYFPPVPDAARMADAVFKHLLAMRSRDASSGGGIPYKYTRNNAASCQEILGFLAHEARWQ
jgi:hypothetical protein